MEIETVEGYILYLYKNVGFMKTQSYYVIEDVNNKEYYTYRLDNNLWYEVDGQFFESLEGEFINIFDTIEEARQYTELDAIMEG